jgi:hypothetical protein
MKSFFRSLSLTSLVCAVSGSAMAGVSPLAAPVPEIGSGAVSAAVATVVVLGCVMLPRVKRLLQSKPD